MSEQKFGPSSEGGSRGSTGFTSQSPLREQRDDGGEHEPPNHFTLLYETQAQQFASAIPFIWEGLSQNERCLYVINDNTESEVVATLEEVGISVEAARESGQLMIHTADETYLRTGEFDPDDMLGFWESALETAYDQGYTGLRAAAEMTWARESGTSEETLIAYEESLNQLFASDEYAVLCQYNRDRFSSDVLSDIVDHHPKLVHDDTVAENVYYAPSNVAADQASSEQKLDWQLGTIVERARAEARLKRREQGLSKLNEATQELMQDDYDEITDRAAALARSVLDVEFTSVWPFNEETGELELQSSATTIEADVTALADVYEERAWQTYISEQTETQDELEQTHDLADVGTPLRSGVIVPLGRHGVFCAGSSRPDMFNETMVDLAETVASNVEAALDRADRETALETRTDELTRLDRLNTVIRQIDQALVDAETREEIDRVVCEQLADSELYEFAWIGQHDAAADTVDPQEWAGVDSGYVDDLTITTDDTSTGQGPVGTAVRTRETQVVKEIATDARFDPWREETLAQGVRSCISVPLVYEDTLYGVLNVYAETLNTDEKDRAILNELGETIAHTISAIETKETLHTDTVVELTLGFQPSDSILGRLAQQAGCQIEFEGFVPQTDDMSDVFFTAHGATPDEIQTAGAEAVAVEELTHITDRDDGSLFKVRLSGSTLASLLVEQNAVVRTLSFESDDVTAVVEIPSTVTVREFVEAIQTTHPGIDLLTRRTRERSIQTPQEFKTAVEDDLTARQQEILRTAYLGGFFQSPRESTGSDIANLLEISQSTFTQHLRAGQHNLFELLFEKA